ncbi:MAG: DUF1638 domain-containing protein [Actinomycetota bacterium]|nr:DUF1638 domain-containing protein [Actinomycetota bacterium]
MADTSFKEFTIVSCGSLRMELNHLKEEGFLDVEKIFFTTPGLHEIPRELEKQLVRQMGKGKDKGDKAIVLYGDRCFVDSTDYFRSIDKVIQEQGMEACRVKAHNCIDILTSEEEREEIAAGRRVYWLIPGWIEYKKNVFLEWDDGKANETFPSNDLAILLDPIEYYEKLAMKDPEKLLQFSDWMGISIEPFPITLDRLKDLLLSCRISLKSLEDLSPV